MSSSMLNKNAYHASTEKLFDPTPTTARTPKKAEGMDWLECSQCLRNFFKPKMLPDCLHMFCLKCITEYCSKFDPSASIPCPTCQREFFLPEGGVTKLRENSFIEILVLIKESKEGKLLLKCEPCYESDITEEAIKFCIECRQCFCETCYRKHATFNVARNHKVLGITDKPSEAELRIMTSMYCSKVTHELKKTDFYCSTCNDLICSQCIKTYHRKHLFLDMAEAAKIKKNQILNEKSTIEGYGPQATKELEALSRDKAIITKQLADIRNLIEDKFSSHIEELMSYKNDLLMRVQNEETNQLQRIQNLEDSYTLQNKDMDFFLNYSKLVLEKGTYYDLVREARDLHTRADQFIKSFDERKKGNTSEISLKFVESEAATDFEKLIGKLQEREMSDTDAPGEHFESTRASKMPPLKPALFVREKNFADKKTISASVEELPYKNRSRRPSADRRSIVSIDSEEEDSESETIFKEIRSRDSSGERRKKSSDKQDDFSKSAEFPAPKSLRKISKIMGKKDREPLSGEPLFSISQKNSQKEIRIPAIQSGLKTTTKSDYLSKSAEDDSRR